MWMKYRGYRCEAVVAVVTVVVEVVVGLGGFETLNPTPTPTPPSQKIQGKEDGCEMKGLLPLAQELAECAVSACDVFTPPTL
jgi:hypothetical protein